MVSPLSKLHSALSRWQEKYTLREFLRRGMHPVQVATQANKLYHTRFHTRDCNPHGVDFLDRDWDNLVLLDACRADAFEQRIGHVDIDGSLERRTSLGSTSSEFIYGNFRNKELYDTVYVSANEFYQKLYREICSEIHWFENINVEFEDHEAGTVPPEVVTDRALRLADEYPHKRFIVHYLQPHKPYLGPAGEKFDQDNSLAESFRNSTATDDDLRAAYVENLDIVLEQVKPVIDELPGKTVISADHGELLGERAFPLPMKTYGHFSGLYVEELVDVPWFTCEFDDRKAITREVPERFLDPEVDEGVNDRLRQLGYKP